MTTTGAPSNSTVDTFIGKFETIILNPAITLLSLVAFVLFLWGVFEYIKNAENSEKRKVGQQHIMWGLIGLFIIFGVGAIIHVLKDVTTIFQ